MNKSEIIVLPKLRDDLIYKEIEENGEKLIFMHDTGRTVEQPVKMPASIMPALQKLDGMTDLNEFTELIKKQYGSDVTIDSTINLINELEFLGYLLTPTHDLLVKNQRPAVCAGNSYPKDPVELRSYLDYILSTSNKESIKPNADTIIVPHIDYQIGEGSHKAYSSAYNAIRDTKADLFVIFGTSHYGSSARFMMSERDFHTPLGVVKNDVDLLYKLNQELSYDLTVDEIAHRLEHSIELQIIMLKHIFADREFSVLPVLIGSFHDFVMKRELPGSDSMFSEFIDSLKNVILKSGRESVYIASVDFAHVGRRFDDEFNAELILDELKAEDTELINHLAKGEYDDFFNAVSSVGDRRRICGLSPIYSMLKLREKKQGELLHYHQWNDKPTSSAVTFASIAYYD